MRDKRLSEEPDAMRRRALVFLKYLASIVIGVLFALVLSLGICP